MSFSKVYTAQHHLLKAHIVDVEVDISNGLHSFSIVGLPDKAVEESRDRVSAAIKNSGFTSPKSKNQKVVISLAPADIKKEGPLFDVAIALSYLVAVEDISFSTDNKLFLGELSLNGTLRPIHGTLSLVRYAQEVGFQEVYVPKENAEEAALIPNITIYAVETLKELIEHLSSIKNDKNKIQKKLIVQPPTKNIQVLNNDEVSIDDIKGNEIAKRGLEIAAAGGHNIALYGPPGTGKTLLAKAFNTLLPDLTFEDALEITSIHSIAGILKTPLLQRPPFRSPHHTSSYVSLVGGGTIPKPGEITLAHNGILFLDEFPEFDRRVIESLRQPLEDKVVSISRSKGSALFPANFILIATMNPCPCGNYGSDKICTCTPSAIARYQQKISGPIIDRIDLWIEVSHVEHNQLLIESQKKSEGAIQQRIKKARQKQKIRSEANAGHGTLNALLPSRGLLEQLSLPQSVQDFYNHSAKQIGLSARMYHKILKVARTIADLEEKKDITKEHILEALQYRPAN